jgi:hypothetical protein
MPKGFELLWFLCVVFPVVVITIRTCAARHQACERERAWKIAERYIFCGALPTAGGPPEPSRSSALSIDSDVEAIAA